LDWQNRSFTGGSASDMKPKSKKEQAENIKQLLMGKIQNNCKWRILYTATTAILYRGFNTFLIRYKMGRGLWPILFGF
jgi:hypothetical protein